MMVNDQEVFDHENNSEFWPQAQTVTTACIFPHETHCLLCIIVLFMYQEQLSCHETT